MVKTMAISASSIVPVLVHVPAVTAKERDDVAGDEKEDEKRRKREEKEARRIAEETKRRLAAGRIGRF